MFVVKNITSGWHNNKFYTMDISILWLKIKLVILSSGLMFYRAVVIYTTLGTELDVSRICFVLVTEWVET